MRLIAVFLIFYTMLFADTDDTKKIEMEIAKVYMNTYKIISVASVTVRQTLLQDEPNLKFVSIDNASVTVLKDKGQVGAIFKTPQGELKKRIYRYDIDASIEATRAKTIIAKDQLVALENIEPMLLKIGAFADIPLSPNEVIDKNAKRFIPKGTVIMQRDVGTLPSVKKGQQISAVYVSDLIEADTEAIALEDGQVGQIITIKIKSGKILRGKIISKDRIELE